MIKIAILDDEIVQIKRIEKVLKEYFKRRKDYEINHFTKSKDILENLLSYDLVLLDIEMPGFTGIQVKNKLDELQYKGAIIFVTGYEQYMTEAFGRNVISYIQKQDLQQIKEVLHKYETRRKENKVLVIGDTSYLLSDIIHITSEDGCAKIIARTGVQYTCVHLYEILNRLNSDMFVRIHRSDIINMRYVSAFTSTKVTLLDNKTLVLSRKYKKEFKSKYIEFLMVD